MFISKAKAGSLLSLTLAACSTAIAWQPPIRAEVNNIYEILVEVSDMMNQSLPMMVDEDVRFDASFVGPGRMLSYKYTLVNYPINQVDSEQLAQFIRTPLTKTICTNPATQIFPKNGVLLNFNYYDNARNLITSVKISPNDCQLEKIELLNKYSML